MLWRECTIDCDESHEDDGLLQRYVHLTREFEAPASYHVFSLLAAVSASVARRVVIGRGGFRLWPNLYVLLHGPSGIGKSIAAGHAIQLVEACSHSELRLYPEDLTGEGLSRIMYDQTVNNVPCVGLVYADEFGDLLGGQQYKEEFAKRLTRLYASPDKFGIGRSSDGERWVKQVYLVILGCSQEDWLRTLPISALTGGMFGRFLTIPETSRRHRRFEPAVNTDAGMEIGEELFTRLGEIQPGLNVASLTKEAYEYGREWYEAGEDARWAGYDPIVKPFLERRLDHAIKLAYLWELIEGNEGPYEIGLNAIKHGLEFVEWVTPRIQTAFLSMHEGKSGELNRMIMDIVRTRNGEVEERIVRQALGYRWKKGELDDGIRHLIESGQIYRLERGDTRFGVGWLLKEVKDGE